MMGGAHREGPTHEVAALAALAADPRLRRLGAAVPPLPLARAFGVARDEVAHSRALAETLDPRKHRGAHAALVALLGAAAGATDRAIPVAAESPGDPDGTAGAGETRAGRRG